MNTTSLRYFLVLTEEMNFSRAAQRLFISQQALSGHIQRLEKQYDIQLFERKPFLKLTKAGEQMCLYAEHIIRTEQQLKSCLTDLSRENSGKLSFGCSRSRAELFLPDIFSKFHAQYPNIDVTVITDIAPQFYQMLHNGKIDLYIGVDPPDAFDTLQTELAEERQYCIMSIDFLKRQLPNSWQDFLAQAYKSGVDLMDLQCFPFILLNPQNRFRMALDYYFADKGIVPHVIFESSLHSSVYALCQQSYGVGLISQMFLYQPLLRSGETAKGILLFPLKNDLGTHHIKLVYRRDKQLPKFTYAFADAIKRTFFEYNHAIEGIITKMTRELPVFGSNTLHAIGDMNVSKQQG
mgnify:CR=1 FL=1